MTGPRPITLARSLVAPAVHLLPRDCRDRYREEFRAELCGLSRFDQIAAAASLLRGGLALRQALVSGRVDANPVPRRPVRCRLGRHRYVLRRDVDLAREHQLSYRCVRCGSYFERASRSDEGVDIEAIQRNANFFSGGGM